MLVNVVLASPLIDINPETVRFYLLARKPNNYCAIQRCWWV